MAETGINAVMRSILRLLLTLVSGIAGYQTAQLLEVEIGRASCRERV